MTGSLSRPRFRLFQGGFLAVLALLFASGCAKPNGTISGTVYYDGKVVKGGTVAFFTLDGKTLERSEIAEDGSYSIASMPIGDVRISVTTRALKPNPMQDRARASMPKGLPPEAAGYMGGGGNADRYVPIPDRYSEFETSQLIYNVVAGPQEHKIELAK
jgi:hypothetical protein